MTEKFIRVYKKFDVTSIKSHLMIYGDLSAACGKCDQIDLKLEMTQCPSCQTEFQYIAFRNIKTHFPKIQKLSYERPGLIIVDFDDYKRNLGVAKAEEFLR